MDQQEQIKGCPLFRFCNCKTAVCKVKEPDESCFWYRYFKELIKKQEKNITNEVKIINLIMDFIKNKKLGR